MGNVHTVLNKPTTELLDTYCEKNNCSRYAGARSILERVLQEEKIAESPNRKELIKNSLRQSDTILKNAIKTEQKRAKDFSNGVEQSEDMGENSEKQDKSDTTPPTPLKKHSKNSKLTISSENSGNIYRIKL
jgi:ABC-type proline/glycine betaine transport system ATPase subunit